MRKTRSQTQKSQENTIIAAFNQTRQTNATNGGVSKQIPTASIQVSVRSGFLWKSNWQTDSTVLKYSVIVLHICSQILVFFLNCKHFLLQPMPNNNTDVTRSSNVCNDQLFRVSTFFIVIVMIDFSPPKSRLRVKLLDASLMDSCSFCDIKL